MRIGKYLFFLLMILFLLVSCGRKTFTVGVITNLEGLNVQSSSDAFKSITMAYDEAKEQYPGLEITLLPVDNSDDPDLSVGAYQSVSDLSDAYIIITTSTAFIPMLDVIGENEDKLHFQIGATTTLFSELDDNILRNTVDMSSEQREIAQFVNNRYKGRLLILRESERNGAYTSAALEYFGQSLDREWDVLEFSAATLRFEGILEAIKSERYGGVYVLAGGTPREAGILIQKISEVSPELPIVSTPWVRGVYFIQALGKSGEGVVVPGHISTEYLPYRKFEETFASKFGGLPAYQAPLAYDAAKILFEALHEVRDPSSEKLKNYILDRSFQGTTGELSFDSYGDVKGKLFFYRISDDGYEQIE